MNTSRLMIVAGEKAWTLAALHLACAISRRSGIELLLVKMISVRHPFDLGTSAGYLNFSAADAFYLNEMQATAEDYGICLPVELFQYADYWPGLVDAASQFGATAVIAQLPYSPIPYLRNYRRWWLRRRLAKNHQLFVILDELTPTVSWTPSISLQNNIAYSIEQHLLGEQL
jgi:hypothetical protein